MIQLRIAICVAIYAIQLLMAAAWAIHAFGFAVPEIALYALFCFSAIGLSYLLQEYARTVDPLKGRLSNFNLAIEAILTAMLLCAAFKTIIYDHQSQLAQNAVVILLILIVLNKFFVERLSKTWELVYQFCITRNSHVLLRPLIDIGCVALIIVLIYIPDAQAVVARIFIGEQFHHWDSSILSPAWAYTAGSILDVDVISRYGLGLPIVLAEICKWIGGFSFEHLFSALMLLTVVYYVLAYCLLRLWFGQILIAIATILFGIKIQMFHVESMPLCFTYPSATVLRYCFDLLMFFCLWAHLRQPRREFLVAASVICGIALFHITPEGAYLTLSFYFYCVCYFFLKRQRINMWRGWRDTPFLSALLAMPFITMLILMRWTVGEHLWTKAFWLNSYQFLSYYKNGMSLSPMYQSLLDHNFCASLVSFIIPLVFIATLLSVCALVYFRKLPHTFLFAAVWAVYGLGLYHYYVGMSATTSYYASGLPYVFLLGFWSSQWIKRFSTRVRFNIALALAALALFSLVTNHLFVSYPNMINVSSNPMTDPAIIKIPPGRVSYFNHLFREYPEAFKLPANSLGEKQEDLRMEKDFRSDQELKDYYLKEFNFEDDAKLIDRLTDPHDPVPLISSFEARFLMQANRKPFFFFFPLVNSRPLRMRMFVVPNYFTIEDTQRTLNQLEEAKPPYVFMERIFLNRNVPQAYYFDSQGLMEVLDYVNTHYSPVDTGKYLVAMKRNST